MSSASYEIFYRSMSGPVVLIAEPPSAPAPKGINSSKHSRHGGADPAAEFIKAQIARFRRLDHQKTGAWTLLGTVGRSSKETA